MMGRWWALLVGLWAAGQAGATDEVGGTKNQYLASLTARGPLAAQLEWRFTQAFYFDAEGSAFARTTMAGLSWLTRPWLTLGAAYQRIHVDDATGSWNRQRVTASSALAWRHPHWTLGYRLTWQGDWRDPREGGFQQRETLRNQVQFRYAGFSHVTPYASLELWNRIDIHRARAGVDRTRYQLGADTRLSLSDSCLQYVRGRTQNGVASGVTVKDTASAQRVANATSLSSWL